MRAVLQRGYGGPEVVEVVDDAPEPRAGHDEVVVEIRAAAVDRGTWHLMTGTPLAVRLALGPRRPRQPVVGRDLAGVVVEVGPDVHGFAVGDEVFGTADGSLAERTAAKVRRLAPKPAALSFAEAAAVPVSALTALQALRAGRLREGQRVLVIGASGGVGSYAVQLAQALGATEVVGVCSAAKAGFVRSLGAAATIDHRTEAVDARGTAYDLVLDIAGCRRLRELRALLAPGGSLVLVGGLSGRWLGVRRQLLGAALSPFVRQRIPFFVSREDGRDLAELGDLATKGLLRPAVDATHPLERVHDALDDLDGGPCGKVVVTVTG
ncbi:NAD(P)-dependent alcohol dehydrogenase [Nocardioides sp. GCM10027113]|uniref:NAD(P)-dependent alcohol dehydrogenase n=1 Tax=unclassified Nocardioides TaxID=2615069 RepID=UPI003623EDA4